MLLQLAPMFASLLLGAGAPAAPPLPPFVPQVIATPVQAGAPQQVNVSVKIVEFQATKGVSTGMSAYFARRNEPRPFGRVSSGNGDITTADLTFPLDSEAAITVFLDRLHTSAGDLEGLLQALVNENKAFILDEPKSMVKVRSATPTIIKTVEENPYESPTVVGTTVVSATEFRNTGVTLTVHCPDIVDDDGNWTTTEDTYIKLSLITEVKELGEDLIVAFDNRLAGANQVSAPTFVSRSIKTDVWVRHGQVLILGGLFRNLKIKDLDSVPGLGKTEELAMGMLNRIIPGDLHGTPLSSTLGNRNNEVQRRELVFFIKAEAWKPAYTVAGEEQLQGSGEKQQSKEHAKPTDVISNVIGGITNIPKGIAEGIAGEKKKKDSNDLKSELGGAPK